MSAEHGYPDETLPSTPHVETSTQSASESRCRSHTVTLTGSEHASESSNASDPAPTDPPLAARIERTQLRLQVATLRRALETSERRRQAVIDRYEQLLAERDRTSADPSADRSSSAVKRLLEVWP